MADAIIRSVRIVPEREFALALVLEYAECDMSKFSLLGFYDDDFEFVKDLAERLKVEFGKPFVNKLTKVVRHLVRYGVLSADMESTQKYYIGEPTKQMNYRMQPGKVRLIQKGKTDFTMSPEGEALFLLRHAYPEEDANA